LASTNRPVSFHPDVLSRRQHVALRRLGPVMSAMDFSLAGGTALALYLGHRRSIDCDWFTGKRMPEVLRLAQMVREHGIPLTVQQIDRGTLHASVLGVRMAFFEYRYPNLKAPVALKTHGCLLASLDDIACMKLSAVAQLGTKKDFVDVFALLQAHATLGRMLTLYRRKYSVADVLHVLRALAYFDDAEAERMPRMLWEAEWPAIKDRIRRAVRRVANET
jgi:hypothetical protein